MDLHKCGSSFAISISLEVPCSSVQTIICKYKKTWLCTTIISLGKEKDSESEMCESTPGQQQKTLKILAEDTACPQQNESCTSMSPKVTLGGESYYFKTIIKKSQSTVCNCIWSGKILISADISCGLTKQKLNSSAITINGIFGGRSCEASEHHPSCEVCGWQHHVVGQFCRTDTSQNRWYHVKRKLCEHIEATSEGLG